MSINRVFAGAALAVGALGIAQAESLDMAGGEEIYQEVCKNCHGPKAQGMASFPKLADKTAEHLVMRLGQYRAQEKVGPNSPLMWPHAEELSDEDIANLAAYITEGIE